VDCAITGKIQISDGCQARVKMVLLSKRVWGIIRTSYRGLPLVVQQDISTYQQYSKATSKCGIVEE
jgi:hypothetical protein